MPDGWNQVFGAERFRPAEALFDENAAITVSVILVRPLHAIRWLTSTRIPTTQSQNLNKPFQGWSLLLWMQLIRTAERISLEIWSWLVDLRSFKDLYAGLIKKWQVPIQA
jgi:hypothetical protein